MPKLILSCRNCDHLDNIQEMTFDCEGPPMPVRGLDIKKLDKHYEDSTCYTNKKLGYKGVE